MKKLFALLLVFMMIFALCACKKTEGEDNTEHTHTQSQTQATTHTHTEDSQPSEDNPASTAVADVQPTVLNTNEASDKVDTEGHYKESHISKIDVPCADEINKAQSDAVKKTIYDKYAEEWAEVSQRYYKELLKIKGSVPATENFNTAEQMHEYLEFYKQDWENNFAQQTQTFTNQMIEGADNTGLELMLAQLTYESKRELALYFIGIYEDIEYYSNQGY